MNYNEKLFSKMEGVILLNLFLLKNIYGIKEAKDTIH